MADFNRTGAKVSCWEAGNVRRRPLTEGLPSAFDINEGVSKLDACREGR